MYIEDDSSTLSSAISDIDLNINIIVNILLL